MEVVFTNQAEKDLEKIKQYPALLKKVQNLLDLVENNPFETPPTYEKLVGFESVYSRRINVQHRLIYEVIKEKQVVKIIRMWTHYE
ncbi:MAG: Txe/YoeB family addiction module toxin [Bacilli bacterium]|nr:Txe/YoeB family addiction module toxin [Bacilli bacterium]